MKNHVNRRGAATVEFAVTAPLFLFLILATIEFGRMIQVQQKLTAASAVGARYASSGATQDEVDLSTNACFWGLKDPEAGLQWSNIASTEYLQVGIEELDNRVTVSASVNFEQVAWMPPFWIDTMITGRTTMFREPGNVND